MVELPMNSNNETAALAGGASGARGGLPVHEDLPMLAALLCAAPVAQVLVTDGGQAGVLAAYGQVKEGMHAVAEVPLSVGADRILLRVSDEGPRDLQPRQRAGLEALVRLVSGYGAGQNGTRALAPGKDEPGQTLTRAALERQLQDEWLRHGRRKESLGLLLISCNPGVEAPAVPPVAGVSAGSSPSVVSRVGESLRSSDFLAEFDDGVWAALLPSVGLNAAMAAAQRIRQIFERNSSHPRANGLLHIGVAVMTPGENIPARQLEDRARHALDQARRGGSGRIEAFHGW